MVGTVQNISTLTRVGAAIFSIAIATYTPEAVASVLLPISNAGFEDSLLTDTDGINNDFTLTAPPDWNLFDPSGLIPSDPNNATSFVGAWNPPLSSYAAGAPEGENVAFILVNEPIGSGIVALTQTLSSTLMANTKYTLEVEVGNTVPDPDFPDLGGFPGYQIQLLAGGNILALDDNSLNITEGTFETSSISFTVPDNHPNLGDALEIRLLNILESDGQEVDFDNVRLEAASVPEPSTILGLLAIGGLGLDLKRRKKQA